MRTLLRNDDRRDLTEFLRTRRARLSPLAVGLANGTRRRTPGLRREEVAQLAGVGATWYTWFEQGRDIRVSTHFLESLARALRLDGAERAHLFALAQHRLPPLAPVPSTPVTPALQHMLDHFPAPACVKTARWDLVAWNRAATHIFDDFVDLPPERRNILRLVFTNPRTRQVMVDWEGDARRALAKFRLDYGRAPGDPSFAALIAELDATSPEFHLWWSQHDVLEHGEGIKIFRHAKVGDIEFEHTSFVVDASPELRMVLYTPRAGASAEKMRRLMTGMTRMRPLPPGAEKTKGANATNARRASLTRQED